MPSAAVRESSLYRIRADVVWTITRRSGARALTKLDEAPHQRRACRHVASGTSERRERA